jgi:hypothetical protein
MDYDVPINFLDTSSRNRQYLSRRFDHFLVALWNPFRKWTVQVDLAESSESFHNC